MIWEYALFDLFIACPIVAMAWLRPQWLAGGWRPALRATLVGAVPFVIWDALVVDRHWWFHPDRVLGIEVLGLPIEELGFFVVVPLACLVTWELLVGGARSKPRGHMPTWPLVLGLLVAAALLASTGREYTALACVGLGVAALVDDALGTRVASLPAAWRHALVVVALTSVFNGYLTARPIVLYDPAMQLDWRIGTVPIEDYAFGLALVWITTALYQRRRGRVFAPSWLARAIRARFGGYIHRVVEVDPSAPLRLTQRRTVLVVGGGLAGLSAAELLARRGFEVTLLERDAHLGGKLAAWRERLPDGFDAPIEHGFHAFFRHYYNLGAWLRELGLTERLRPIPDYAIVARDGSQFGFAGASNVPLLNLMGLAELGFFRWRDVLRPQTGRSLELLLRYDASREDESLDALSFAEWADAARLPPRLRLAFTTFARAFFADEHSMSMAELVKSFHFYYLSHDHGLVYDYLDGAYDEALVDPIARHLRAQGVTIQLERAVNEIRADASGLRVDGVAYDHIVLAADVAATARILAASPTLCDRAPIATALPSMRAGQRYAVARLWLDRPLGADMPPFVITEREHVLDAIAFVSRTDPNARTWTATHGGSVLELHCYAVPDEIDDDAVERALLDEAEALVAGLADATVVHRHLQLRRDFTALHVGMRRDRPTVDSGVEGLWFAGDWVKLPWPAMLMEAAHGSARLVADRICTHEGVAGFAIDSVPLQGALAPR
jgi:isorenieratene synthase